MYANQTFGYSISYPSEWAVTEEGAIVQIRHPLGTNFTAVGERLDGATLEEFTSSTLSDMVLNLPSFREGSRMEVETPPGYLIEGDVGSGGLGSNLTLVFTTNGEHGIAAIFVVQQIYSKLHQPVLEAMLASLRTFPVTGAVDAATPVSRYESPLIPRAALFVLLDRTDVKLSREGTRLSYRAPYCGERSCAMNVWVAPLSNLSEARPVTRDTDNGVHSYSWAHTNDHILYTHDVSGDENYRVYSVDLTKGEAKLLTPLEGVQARINSLSPKNPRQVLVSLNERDPAFHDLFVVDIDTGERRLVQKNEGFASFIADDDYRVRFAVRFTPDGGKEILRATESGDLHPFMHISMEDVFTTSLIDFDKSGKVLYMEDSLGRDTSALVAVNLDTGEKTVIASDARADLDDLILHPTEKHPQAVAFTYERKHWVSQNEAVSDAFSYLRTVSEGDIEIVSRSQSDRRWIVAYLMDNGPRRFYLYDRDEGMASFLFTDGEVLEGLPLARMRPVVVESRDGLDLVSYLTLPLGTDPDGDARPNVPLPMVLLVHGGPWARDKWGFDYTHQWLANRGYAVLSVNFRGSTGFGKAFLNGANREWAGKMHNDLVDAVGWAVEEKIALPKLVGIMGGSYGGYATLVGLTFTPETFACGVDLVGPSNLVTFLETVPPYWEPQIELFVTRVGDHRTEEGRAFLAKRSPLTHVERITRPLLIAQGGNDPRVKQSESDQIVRAMREKGIPVTYLLYPDEGHGFSSATNLRSFNAVAEAFFSKCLGGRYEPIGDDFGRSSITTPVGAEHVPGLSP